MAHRSCVPHRTLLAPPVAWLGLMLSLSLYFYGLRKTDHLVHWGGEFVGVKGEDYQCGLYHCGGEVGSLGRELGRHPRWDRWVLSIVLCFVGWH